MENVQTRKRGEHGIGAFKSKIHPAKYQVKFHNNNIPNGGMPNRFNSWYGYGSTQVSIDIKTGKLEETYFKDLWLETKVFIF